MTFEDGRTAAQTSSAVQADAYLRPDAILCLSHLRWDFVFQRPQHLMSRFARQGRPVIYFEEPVEAAPDAPAGLDVRVCPATGVTVAVPRLPAGLGPECRDGVLRRLLDALLEARGVEAPVLWYYTPMALPFSRHLQATAVVYDCMDELSAFRFAPQQLRTLERELLGRADHVFTGGHSLWEAKRELHPRCHAFPSAVDRAHFAAARDDAPERPADPADQRELPHPRLGFYGVIDERMDLDLLAAVADARPGWSIVLVGPVVKIDPADLPRRPNLHYLGGKSYAELPAYLGGWDVALMPFALNESTRFISPTKTPEYLAGGRPVVSTPVVDVARCYGGLEAVRIADGPEAFVAACEAALALPRAPGAAWLAAADAVLADQCWDRTHARMSAFVADAVKARSAGPAAPVVRPSDRRPPYDVLVVGAGFAGSVMAERLAAGSDKRVLLIDRRPHLGGNAYDRLDGAGVRIHQYGPHIFHTNSQAVFDYLSRFTRWRPYEHRVLADVGGRLLPMPINRTTLNELYGLSLDSEEAAEAFLNARAEQVDKVRTSEDVVVARVGRELYETFFRGYTRKQWGMDPSELDKAVTARVPVRTNTDDRYFTDVFQAMPRDGYTRLFENMVDHPNIDLALGEEFEEVRREVPHARLIYTGPIDEYFGHRFGELPYRSLSFRHETLDREWLQPVAVVNHPSEDTPWTRVTEYKHLTGQTHPKTSVTYEYPSSEGDPYYPIPRAENQALYKRYEALAQETPEVTFVGRLATYRYYNMDQVVGQALATWRKMAERAGAQVAA